MGAPAKHGSTWNSARTQVEHAIAVLTGHTALGAVEIPVIRIARAAAAHYPSESLPSVLPARRPDIAAE